MIPWANSVKTITLNQCDALHRDDIDTGALIYGELERNPIKGPSHRGSRYGCRKVVKLENGFRGCVQIMHLPYTLTTLIAQRKLRIAVTEKYLLPKYRIQYACRFRLCAKDLTITRIFCCEGKPSAIRSIIGLYRPIKKALIQDGFYVSGYNGSSSWNAWRK